MTWLAKWFLFIFQDAMLMTKERELKEAVREGRDRVSIFGFFLSFTLATGHGKQLCVKFVTQ